MLFDNIYRGITEARQSDLVVIVSGVTLQSQGVLVDCIAECLVDGIRVE